MTDLCALASWRENRSGNAAGDCGRSSTRHSWSWLRVFILGLALLVAAAAPARALPPLCLPPVFEGGRRLHDLPAPRAFWLPALLRQHELCWWRALHPETIRVVVLGSSAVFGLPLEAGQTFTALVNADFEARRVPARVFNLAWVVPYQLRDAVIAEAALHFDPDVIVYLVSPDTFIHASPIRNRPTKLFMRANARALYRWLGDPPPGLAGPLEGYRRDTTNFVRTEHPLARLLELGPVVRNAANEYAESLLPVLVPGAEPRRTAVAEPSSRYDCVRTKRQWATDFQDWQSWNALEYFASLRRRQPLEVVVVNWPLGFAPVGDCFNRRFPMAAVEEFNRWLSAETQRLSLPYIDLYALLDPSDFFDSVHPRPEGHRKLAERLAPSLEAVVRDAGVRRAQIAARGGALQ